MKQFLTLSLAVLMTGFFTGCDQPASAPAKPKMKVGFVGRHANDYWSLVRFGCDTAVLTSGDVELDFRMPSGRTAEEQNQILNELVASGVQAIAISPIDGDGQAAVLNAISTNILLVCADDDAGASRRSAYIGTDNVAAGVQAAGLLKAALPQGGKVALLVGSDKAHNARERIQGIQEGLKGTGIEIVGTLVDGMNESTALQNAQKALVDHPEISGMVGLYSYNGPAILSAVTGAGKAGAVKIVCFDANTDTLDGIAAGNIFGTIVQNPYKIGHRSIELIAKQLRGDKQALAAGIIHIPSQVVTRENVEQFRYLSGKREQ